MVAGNVREASVFPICLREFEVVRVWDVTPGMRRVVVGGPAMREHVRDGIALPAVKTTGFDDDIKVMPTDPVTGGFPFEVPRNTAGGVVDWTPGSFDYLRTYTVRAFDADAGEMTIDFALHETGLASTWARRVQPGDGVLIAGPKHSAGLPTAADWMLIGGDETALPAIGHCLEKLPPSLPATVVIEVAEPSHRQELTSAAPVDITWLYRSDVGGRSRLVETIQAAQWRAGQPFLWVGGETLTIKPLRRWAKQEKQIPKDFTQIIGYWRRREVATVEGHPELVDVAAEGPGAFDRIHELSELLPPFALRVAVTLGVFAEIEGGTTTVEAIAAACGAQPEPLRKLLRHLAVLGLVNRVDGGFSLTEDGSLLSDPDGWLAETLHLDGFASQVNMSFVGLLDVIRTGVPAGVGGLPVGEWLKDPVRLGQLHDAQAGEASYLAPALKDAISFDGVQTVAIVGEGGGAYADALLREFESLNVSVVGMPTLTARMLGDVARQRQSLVKRIDRSHTAPLGERVDLLIVSNIVDTLPDEDTAVALAAYTESADRIVIATTLLDPDTTDDHHTEDDLSRLCVFGSGRRTEAELREMISSIGAEVVHVGPLGWGAHVVEYRART
ncbi:NADPH-dependent ferric siderophore reductase [Williamsia limnetica]|uniref:NADPH-dependent ferric siderophore reductase n=1 Tax=Williamsia limnetica TaxID=882452 RepID=A0A318RGF2_WILLI|nr:siderophore-interacting protein [Williamsia limnetica]PYE12081.1 NADPH-dependent ferric siderophore reductase [Williamsia limnetica]